VPQQILVGTRKGLFTVERNDGWRVKNLSFRGDTVLIVLPDGRDGSRYAALHHGHFGSKLHRSRDGGATWQECGVPAYPPQPEGVEDKDAMGRPVAWKLDRIWALEPGHASEPGVLWCGTLPGGLFRSSDSGSSWELVRSLWDRPERKFWFGGGADLPGIHSICVHPQDGRRITIGISCGGVWRTSDGGASWELGGPGMWAAYMPPEQANNPNIQDPHRVVQCQARPECLWAQHHNGVFRSTDGAASWQDIKSIQPSVFGFAVAVHPHDPNRTRDGGATCEVITRGLPQEHAYDLTFRHALDVDRHGQTLAFGSTTGSLWVSDNAGDSWQQVSAHLPPIYCVRFADQA
jgi:hypothetical protein